ncbi:unnamed protein product [Blepharisma stoltei]|uniref:Uncharacterized protein n=1 Tax=Blepharisma stoltei TaxID=1481888 RepID=A0AAU9JM61_9CILI|nr:unnamed protein product [Blepharisma stoltei]
MFSSSYLISGIIESFWAMLNDFWDSVFAALFNCAAFFQELRDFNKLYFTAWFKLVSKSLMVFEWSIYSSWVVGLLSNSNTGLFLGADLTFTALVFLLAIAVFFLWWLIFHLFITFWRLPLKILAKLKIVFFIFSFWLSLNSSTSSIITIGFDKALAVFIDDFTEDSFSIVVSGFVSRQ